MIASSAEERLTLYGQCSTVREVEEFIHFKAFDGWKVLVLPFPTEFKYVNIENTNGVTGRIPIPCEWGFVLHKFHINT